MKKSSGKKRPIKAWLITRGSGLYAALAKGKGEIVDILSARKSAKDVAVYVQRLHDLNCLTLSERARCARENEPIYKVECHWHTLPKCTKDGAVAPPDLSRSPQIFCGHDPCFVAQLVNNLVVERDAETGEERVTWEPWSPRAAHRGAGQESHKG